MSFFQKLSALAFDQIDVTFKSLKDGNVLVTVKPHNFSGDPAYDNLRPLKIEGTPEELDEDFVELIQKPAEQQRDKMAEAKSYIDEINEAEKKTKAKKELQEKVKKEITAAEKITSAEDYDLKKDGPKAIKKYEKALEIDPSNKDASKMISQIRKEINNASSSLFNQ